MRNGYNPAGFRGNPTGVETEIKKKTCGNNGNGNDFCGNTVGTGPNFMMNTAGILNNFQNFPPQSSTLSVTVAVFDREWTSFGYCAV